MTRALTAVLMIAAVLVGGWAAWAAVRRQVLSRAQVLALMGLELALVVQALVSIVSLAAGHEASEAGTHVVYALGSLLLFDTATYDFGVDRSIIFTAVATLGSFVLAVSYLVFRSQKAKPSLGMEGLIGEIGVAREKLDPRGTVFVHGEYWKAQADEEIMAGDKVEVVGIDRMVLKVRRADRVVR